MKKQHTGTHTLTEEDQHSTTKKKQWRRSGAVLCYPEGHWPSQSTVRGGNEGVEIRRSYQTHNTCEVLNDSVFKRRRTEQTDLMDGVLRTDFE